MGYASRSFSDLALKTGVFDYLIGIPISIFELGIFT